MGTPNLASACFMVDAIVGAIDQLRKRVFVGLLHTCLNQSGCCRLLDWGLWS
jgi:hypothetical protein